MLLDVYLGVGHNAPPGVHGTKYAQWNMVKKVGKSRIYYFLISYKNKQGGDTNKMKD